MPGLFLTLTLVEFILIKCCEVFFETLNSPGLCMQYQSALTLYGSGSTTGICVDLGYDTADVTPVYEGGVMTYAIIPTRLAVQQMLAYIKNSLHKRLGIEGLSLDVLEEIKTKVYLTSNIAMSRKGYMRDYKLPDGRVVNVGQEAFMAGELLFQPDGVTETKTGYVPLHEAVLTASLKCDADLRSSLYEAIIPCGGMATVPGLNERLAIEMEKLCGKPVNVMSSPEAYTVSWLGGATFAGMSDAKKMWVTKKQYEDYGVKIIRNKFL